MSSRVAFSRLSRRDHDTPTGNRARLDALSSRPNLARSHPSARWRCHAPAIVPGRARPARARVPRGEERDRRVATGGRPAELARLNVDVIVTGGTHASFAAAKVTTTIPIVFVGVAGPLEAGLVTSLARPGGNITGLAFDVTPETVAKRLELFKEVAPKAARLGHLVNPNNPFFSLYIRSVEIGAQAFRVELQRVEVRAPEDFDGWSSRQRIGCLRCTACASSWRLAGCSPTLQTFQKCSLARADHPAVVTSPRRSRHPVTRRTLTVRWREKRKIGRPGLP